MSGRVQSSPPAQPHGDFWLAEACALRVMGAASLLEEDQGPEQGLPKSQILYLNANPRP